MFEELNWNCTEDGVKYKKIVEQRRVFKFLLGLNQNLDEVRGRILSIKPLLNIRETFSEVRREESRKKVMMGTQNTASTTENSGSALAARGLTHQSSDNRHKKGRPWCEHCRKPGHTKETCWKIHGKPTNWKPNQSNNGSQGNTASSSETNNSAEANPFNKEQMEVLQKLFNQSGSIIGAGTIAQKGNFLSALNVNMKVGSWIVDSGASDHMTNDATVFYEYNPYQGDFTVRMNS